MTPAGIEPLTFRFVAQHLNHCATAVPSWNWCEGNIEKSLEGVGDGGGNCINMAGPDFCRDL